MKYLQELHRRNSILFYGGMLFTAIFIVFLIGYQACNYVLFEICHWLKPGKFAISFAIYTVTLGWFMEYLKEVLSKNRIRMLSVAIVFLAVMELSVISFESWLTSGRFYSSQIPPETVSLLSRALFITVNTMIVLTTLITLYIAVQFFKPIALEPYPYLLAIRAGFIVFIASCALGGYLIERYGQVPIDSTDYGMPFASYSSRRDILISLHFLGIHYLQLLPLCCYFLHAYMKKSVIVSAVGGYFIICFLFIVI